MLHAQSPTSAATGGKREWPAGGLAMRALVIGGTGLISRGIVKHLLVRHLLG
jgi:hypothetical protein